MKKNTSSTAYLHLTVHLWQLHPYNWRCRPQGTRGIDQHSTSPKITPIQGQYWTASTSIRIILQDFSYKNLCRSSTGQFTLQLYPHLHQGDGRWGKCHAAVQTVAPIHPATPRQTYPFSDRAYKSDGAHFWLCQSSSAMGAYCTHPLPLVPVTVPPRARFHLILISPPVFMLRHGSCTTLTSTHVPRLVVRFLTLIIREGVFTAGGGLVV